VSTSERIAVVVSAHRTYPTLGICLDGLYGAVDKPQDLIFVDNGSSENLGSWASQRLRGISVIKLPENLLFCGGYNAGIRHALTSAYEFVLLVNGDTELVNSNLLEDLVTVARRWPRAAFIGPLVYFRSENTVQKTCLAFPSVSRSILSWVPFRLSPGYFCRPPSKEIAVDFLNGVCVLCRMEALRDVGLMDERFGGYVEDADWSWRAKNMGWLSVFSPIPSVIHHEEPVGYEWHSLKTFLLKRNTVLWFLKTGQERSARLYALASLLLAWLRIQADFTRSGRTRYAEFLDRLYSAYRGLLTGRAMGAWFGPPLGRWT
jgi:N-acetylglucosaminyl-diphospho-decaprenol L-rhamnosyltransferase